MSEHTHTRIVIRHDSIEALKASPIWEQVQKLLWCERAVEVVEIAVHTYDDQEE